MSDSPKYKIVLWMVWVQIALLPVIYLMLYVTNNDLMWRWDLLNWLLVGGYLIGLLALPVSRGLELQPLLPQESYSTFVYPDNFVKINYEG